MKKLIMTALAATTVIGAIGVSAAPAAAQPWGYWHRPHYGYWRHAYWRGYPPYYGYAYAPAYYGPYWHGHYRPIWRRRFHRW